MNCYDCAAHGQAIPAVAICADCGAGPSSQPTLQRGTVT